MAAHKKPSFYHARNRIIPNKKLAADLLGVEITEIERMDKEGGPIMAERLILLWDKKHINEPGWDGWIFSRGCLIHKNKRWRPETLLKIRKDEERIYQLECEIHKLHSISGLIKITKKILSKKYSVRISRLL